MKTPFERPPVWRLLLDPAHEPDWNMAADEAALEGLRQGQSPPTLRLYRWVNPTLSLGYAQVASTCSAGTRVAGVRRVRRASGGRAVLHASDFTYAVTVENLPLSISAAYRVLAGALEAALRQLGVTEMQVRTASAVSGGARAADCFQSLSQADLAWRGMKLLGSAQLRRDRVSLQHGSLYRVFPAELYRQVFATDLVAPVLDLAGLLGREPAWEELATAWAIGFESALGIRLEPGGWTDWELMRIAERRALHRLD